MTLRPLHDRVVLQRAPAGAATESGLVIPDVARRRPPLGRVVATGRGRRTRAGTRVPLVVAVGDTVLFAAGVGLRVTVAGEDYEVVREADILAILDPDPRPAGTRPVGLDRFPAWHPPADVWNGPDDVCVWLDRPGIDPATLRVTALGDTVTVEGTRRPPR